MYWLPIIFVVVNLLYVSNLQNFIKYLNTKKLYDKYKDRKLLDYLDSNFEFNSKLLNFLAVFLVFEFIYLMVAFFYPFWFISAIYIIYIIISSIFNRKENSTEKIIKLANLKGFEASDVKLSRMLKISELEGKNIKTYTWVSYILITLKIIAFASIIVLHYNYKLL